MQKAKKGDTVSVHYTGTLKDESIFDTSEGRDPLTFKIGEGKLLPKFEDAVVGLSIGESTNTSIPAAEGYGLRQDDLVAQIPLQDLPNDLTPQKGMKLQMQTQEGRSLLVTVTEITDKDITIDANHELAGKDLNFQIELIKIED